MINLTDFLCRVKVSRARQEERARFRRTIARVMEANESPDVLLALGQVLELVEEPDDNSSNGREA